VGDVAVEVIEPVVGAARAGEPAADAADHDEIVVADERVQSMRVHVGAMHRVGTPPPHALR
jgi:hypothetical protein